MAEIRERYHTVASFWAFVHSVDDDQQYELVRGEIVAMPPAGGKHSTIEMRLGARLLAYADEHAPGHVTTGDGGYILFQPDTVRAPDISYISQASLPTLPDAYIPLPPELAVEIVSPHDRASQIQAKIDMYLQAGTRLVWVIYPDLRKTVVHHPDGTTHAVSADEALSGGEVLPGFAIKLAQILPE